MGRKKCQPILISRNGLDQSARRALEIKRIGNGQLRHRKVGRVGVGRDDRLEQQASDVELLLSYLPSRDYKQLAITARSHRSDQLVELVGSATAKYSKEL